jgi:hypothetical protein
MNGSPTPILDRIRRRDNEQAEKLIELRRTPQWIKRRRQESQGRSPFVAIKDMSEWRPGPDAA